MFALIFLLAVTVFYLGLLLVLVRFILSGIFAAMQRASQIPTTEAAPAKTTVYVPLALLRGTPHENPGR